jgi:hypothetical protein
MKVLHKGAVSWSHGIISPDFPPMFTEDVWRVFRWIFVTYIFIFLPVILSGRVILDDLHFSISGEYYYGIGRPFGELLNPLFNLGLRAIAAPTLNQVIAISFTSAAAALIAVSLGVKSQFRAAVAGVPFAAHPYFIENISYGFDAHGMAAGVLFATIAGVLVKYATHPVHICISAIFIFATLSVYPSDVNVFFLICIFYLAANFIAARRFRGLLTGSVLASGAGLILYLVSGAASVKLPIAKMASIAQIAQQFGTYWSTLWSDWAHNWIGILIVVNIALGILSLILMPTEQPRSHKRIAVAVGLLVVGGSFQHGIVLLLNYPWPLPRSYVSFGTLLGMLCLTTAGMPQTSYLRFAMVPVVALAYSFALVASAAGAAMEAQKNFELSLATRIIADIDGYAGSHELSSFAIVGNAPNSPVVTNTARKFPVVGRTIPNPVAGDWLWGHVFFRYNGLWLPMVEAHAVRLELANGAPRSSLHRHTYRLDFVGKSAVLVFPPAKFD